MLLLDLVGHLGLHTPQEAARQVRQLLKHVIVDRAPLKDVEPARRHHTPSLGTLRGVARCDRDVDRPVAQDRTGDGHCCRPMLVVLPHGPEHPRQGRQEAAIDGRQRHERRLFGPRQVGLEWRTEGSQDCLQHGRVAHGGRCTQRAQRGPADAAWGLHVREGGHLLQAPQARHGRGEKV